MGVKTKTTDRWVRCSAPREKERGGFAAPYQGLTMIPTSCLLTQRASIKRATRSYLENEGTMKSKVWALKAHF